MCVWREEEREIRRERESEIAICREKETARAIRRVVERDNQSKGLVTTGRGREKSGESEENRERDIEGDTCHVCKEREKNLCNC